MYRLLTQSRATKLCFTSRIKLLALQPVDETVGTRLQCFTPGLTSAVRPPRRLHCMKDASASVDLESNQKVVLLNQQVNDLRRTWACEEVALGHLRWPICNPYQLLRTVVLSVAIGVCPAPYQAVHRVLPLSWSSFQPVPAARLSCLSSYFVGSALPVSLHASKSMIAVCFPSCSLRAPFFFHEHVAASWLRRFARRSSFFFLCVDSL